MSASGDKDLDRKDSKRAKQKQARGRRAAAAGSIDWKGFNWYAVIALAEALSRHGGALRIGQTRDGGAWALGVYLGDDYATEYIRPSEDFDVAIFEIVEAWLPEEQESWELRLKELAG